MRNVPVNIPRRTEDIYFVFEPFLEEYEKNLPKDIEPEQVHLLEQLKDPLKNIIHLPNALMKLPLSVTLSLPWKPYLIISLILFLGYLPAFILLPIGFSLMQMPTGPLVITAIIGIIGYWSAIGSIKITFGLFSNLLNTTRFPWIAEAVKNPFTETYKKSYTKKVFFYSIISLIIPFILFIYKALHQIIAKGVSPVSAIIGGTLSTIALIFVLPVQAILILSLITIQNNTKIYDKLIEPIKNRVVGYNEGFESILTKNNYEVVMILGDTPGHSLRELGDIPLLGLGTLVLVLNSFIYNMLIPVLGEVNAFLNSAKDHKTPVLGGIVSYFSPVGFLFLILLLITVFFSLTTIIIPLFKLWWVIRKFRIKALKELDPYIFDEIQDTALGRKEQMEHEALVLFSLRQYIYQMKTSPVDPVKLTQMVLVYIGYLFKFLPKIAGG